VSRGFGRSKRFAIDAASGGASGGGVGGIDESEEVKVLAVVVLMKVRR
jgi:hypothetical protein